MKLVFEILLQYKSTETDDILKPLKSKLKNLHGFFSTKTFRELNITFIDKNWILKTYRCHINILLYLPDKIKLNLLLSMPQE